MANKNLEAVVTRPGLTSTPQSQKAAPGQKKNNAGGFTFTISPMDRVKRFLILGSDSSFYQSGAQLSKQNADVLLKVIEKGKSRELVDLIVEVSTQGRAAKQDPGLFALAVASSHGTDAEKVYALSKLSEVARTGTTLFDFLTYVQQFRGWGRALAKAVAAWYTEKSTEKVAYQAVKYRQRNGWTHRDVFRKAHPVRTDEEAGVFQVLGEWILRGSVAEELPKVVLGYEKAKTASLAELPGLISEYGLTWEMLPTEALNSKEVWEALLEGNLPLGALLRQLPRLTRLGVIAPLGGSTKQIVARLTDQEALVKARIHPLNLLIALKTYSSGRSLKGESSWTPVQPVVDALDKAFYLAFKAVEPAGKRTLIGLDVSGSMGWGQISGVPLMPSEAVAALSLVTANVEPETHIVGFASEVRDLGISPSMRLDDVLRKTSSMTFGSTDASAAIRYAMNKGLEVDTFVIMTDNDTWSGRTHPHEALEAYRKKMGIPARLVVVATTATEFSIANPNDAGMLDIAGFDTAVPQLITEFSRGL